MPTPWNNDLREEVAKAIKQFLSTRTARLLRHACDLGDEEELLSSLYVKVANSESASRFLASANRADIVPYILVVAKRQLVSLARRHSTRLRLERQLVDEEIEDQSDDRKEFAANRLNSLCQILPLRQKKVVVLKKRGFRLAEIARRLNISERTVVRDWKTICRLVKARATEN